MKIEVKIDDEVVFYGLAEDYLFMNDNDVELELLLDKLELMPYKSTLVFHATSLNVESCEIGNSESSLDRE